MLVALFSASLTLAGCASYYYEVADSHTGKLYYLETMSPPGQLPQSLEVYDPKTRARVITNAYSVRPITEAEYNEAMSQ